MDEIIDFIAELMGWFTGKSSWRRRSKNARRSCDSNSFASNREYLLFQRNLSALPSTILKSLGHAPDINGFTYSRDKLGHFIARLEGGEKINPNDAVKVLDFYQMMICTHDDQVQRDQSGRVVFPPVQVRGQWLEQYMTRRERENITRELDMQDTRQPRAKRRI